MSNELVNFFDKKSKYKIVKNVIEKTCNFKIDEKEES